MAANEATLYEVKQGAAWITLNRPDNRNALSRVLVNELFDHLGAAQEDQQARAVVITGTGPAFCSGADLKNPPGQAADGRRATPYQELLQAVLDSSKPVIAAVNGAAFAGGLGLLGAADIVLIAEDARCSFAEVRIGVIPAIISVVCLPKLGVSNCRRLFLTGARFSGAEAVRLGLAHRAVPKAELAAAVQAEIDMIRLGGPIALGECKKLAQQVPALSPEEGFKLAGEWSLRLFRSDEAAEGMAAFREKRKPAWAAGG